MSNKWYLNHFDWTVKHSDLEWKPLLCVYVSVHISYYICFSCVQSVHVLATVNQISFGGLAFSCTFSC